MFQVLLCVSVSSWLEKGHEGTKTQRKKDSFVNRGLIRIYLEAITKLILSFALGEITVKLIL
jgi:hypothetical protein